MKVKIRYYGILSDIASCETEVIELDMPATMQNLMFMLCKKYPDFYNYPIVTFANGEKLEEDALASFSEIECMPPFSGG